MGKMVIKFLNEIKEPKVSELGGKGYSLTMLINTDSMFQKGLLSPLKHSYMKIDKKA